MTNPFDQPAPQAPRQGERETHLHRIAFQTLSEAALDPVESRALILKTAESHWSGTWRRASA